MITVYAGTDDVVKITATDTDGQAVDWSEVTGVFRIEEVGDYDITAGATATDGFATVLGADTDGLTGAYRYMVLVDDTVSEEGIALMRPTVAEVS